jgi:hypothetical protein
MNGESGTRIVTVLINNLEETDSGRPSVTVFVLYKNTNARTNTETIVHTDS